MAVTLSTSRWCVVAADDEVIAGQEPVVELAKPNAAMATTPTRAATTSRRLAGICSYPAVRYSQEQCSEEGVPASVSAIAR